MVELQVSFEGVKPFLLDICRFGSERKLTAVLSTIDLTCMALQCDKDARPHTHEPLTGTIVVNGQQIFRTILAQKFIQLSCVNNGQPSLRIGIRIPTFELTTSSADWKRPLGQPVPWKAHKQRATAEKAVAAGYQLKRSAMPPLLPCELEPGQAVRVMLDLQHPFTIDPALEPDLQEALSMAVRQPASLAIDSELFNFGARVLKLFCLRQTRSCEAYVIRICGCCCDMMISRYTDIAPTLLSGASCSTPPST